MLIGIANDHRGFLLKQNLTEKLKQSGYNIIDYGCNSYERCNYTDYGFLLGEALRDKKIDYGIAICGSAIGMSIVCNKVKKVRCGKLDTIEDAMHSKAMDYINIASISGSLEVDEAFNLITTFINTENNLDSNYIMRVKQIEDYERGNIDEY